MLLNIHQLQGQLAVAEDRFAQPNESADDINTHRVGLVGVQHVGRHKRPVLGERIRQNRRVFQGFEVVTVCDHLLLFLFGQLETEVGGNLLSLRLTA